MITVVRSRGNRGLTLIEIIFTSTLLVVLAYLSLNALSPAANKASTRGMALSIVDEFRSARQLAISSGQPVAVGIPTDGGANPHGASLYRIKGWNTPYVTWSIGFSGDYPSCTFAAANWGGAAGPNTVTVPATSKFFSFDQAALMEWLPDNTEQDYIFCYLPDGSLITNNLPVVEGAYAVVVAENANFGGAAPSNVTATSGENPITLLISPAGGVQMRTGPTTLPRGGGTANPSTPKPRTQVTGIEEIVLSDIIVRPNPTGLPGEGVCVPGQYVTLEIFAYSPQGVSLFANWTHTAGSATGNMGQFTYPDGQGTALLGEADRMEYIPAHKIPVGPDAPVWSQDPPPPGAGIFRAQWSWTVPITSQELDEYNVTVNVQNATADAVIRNPKPPLKMNPAPDGRLLVERFDPVQGIWQLWRMNPNGTGAKRISPQGVQEIMPTVDRQGNLLALIQGVGANRFVKVRALDGGLETTIAGPGDFSSVSLSPNGAWVSYRDNAGGELFTARTNGSETFPKTQTFGATGHNPRKSRSGWSWNSQYLIYEHDTGGNPSLYAVDLSGANPGRAETHLFGPVTNLGSPVVVEQLYCPSSYLDDLGNERIILSVGNVDPVLIHFPVTPANYAGATIGPVADIGAPPTATPDLGGPGVTGSGGFDDDYPSISLDGNFLVLTRSPDSAGGGGEDTVAQEVQLIPRVGAEFQGPAQEVIGNNSRRAIWLPIDPP